MRVSMIIVAMAGFLGCFPAAHGRSQEKDSKDLVVEAKKALEKKDSRKAAFLLRMSFIPVQGIKDGAKRKGLLAEIKRLLGKADPLEKKLESAGKRKVAAYSRLMEDYLKKGWVRTAKELFAKVKEIFPEFYEEIPAKLRERMSVLNRKGLLKAWFEGGQELGLPLGWRVTDREIISPEYSGKASIGLFSNKSISGNKKILVEVSTGGGAGHVGFIFGIKGTYDYCSCDVHWGGKDRFIYWSRIKDKVLLGKGSKRIPEIIDLKKEWTKFEIDLMGDRVAVRIDGSFPFEWVIEGGGDTNGRIGFMVGYENPPGTSLRFRNFKILDL